MAHVEKDSQGRVRKTPFDQLAVWTTTHFLMRVLADKRRKGMAETIDSLVRAALMSEYGIDPDSLLPRRES